MADRPNNFGEVLFKALGSTAEEAPSIFNDAKTRKKAEALQMFDAMLKLQDAERDKQSQKQAMALREQQMQESAMNMQLINARLLKTQQEIADPYPVWEKQKTQDAEMAKAMAEFEAWKRKMAYAQQNNINLAGNAPSNTGGVGGSFYLTPDDIARRAENKQGTLLGIYQGKIDNAMAGPDTDAATAMYQPKIDELLSPGWMRANQEAPVDSLGIAPHLINPAAMTAQPQPQPQQQSMTREILEAGVKEGKLKKTDPQYVKWDKYFKARNQ